MNNLKAHFGNRVRAFVNTLFNKKEKVERLGQKLKEDNCHEDSIKKAIREEVYTPCNHLKEAVARKEMLKKNIRRRIFEEVKDTLCLL